jgi:hypothetical protein
MRCRTRSNPRAQFLTVVQTDMDPSATRAPQFALVEQTLTLGRRVGLQVAGGAVGGTEIQGWTVCSPRTCVTRSGSASTRSTSHVIERRDVRTSMVMSATHASTANTLRTKST